MNSLPTGIQADYREDYKIHLTFNDVQSTVDFSQWLHGPVFEPLKDVEYFQRFFLDSGTVGCRTVQTLRRRLFTSEPSRRRPPERRIVS